MRGGKNFVVLSLILMISLSFVSAGLFDFFKKTESITITGEAIASDYDLDVSGDCLNFPNPATFCPDGKIIVIGVDDNGCSIYDCVEEDWTQWFDIDNPSGSGDYELLVNENIGPNVCKSHSKIECQTTTGLDYLKTGENVHVDLDKGCWCVNSEQNDGICNYDYKVRFYCGEDLEENWCRDSDGGINFYEKGFIVTNMEPYAGMNLTDSCTIDGVWLHEKYCNEDGTVGFQDHACANEGKICKDGACVKEVVNETGCKDSDGGIDFYEKGFIQGYDQGEFIKGEDHCLIVPYDEEVLNEFRCSDEGVPAIYQIHCSEDCEEGKCIGEEREIPKCIDLDGQDIYKKGKTIGPKFTGYEEDFFISKTYEDECSLKIEDGVTEYFCREGLVSSKTSECENGCVDGACVKEVFNETVCKDSDGGINFYEKGTTYKNTPEEELTKEDSCYLEVDSSGKLVESCFGENCFAQDYFCRSAEDSYTEYLQIGVEYKNCENGCVDGACLKEQEESYCDSKVCHLVEGEKANRNQYYFSISYINEDYSIITIYDENTMKSVSTSKLSEGDEEVLEIGGFTEISITMDEILYSSKDSFPSSVEFKYEINNLIEECKDGCFVEGKCVPVCYRVGGMYCGLDGNMNAQLDQEMICDNSCECESNACVNGQCLSGSLIQKVINWFSRLFGGK